MTDQPDELAIIDYQTMRNRALLVGGLAGALIGMAAAYMYINNLKEGEAPRISAREGVRLAVLVAGLLRGIASR